ncbi:hypothetical protein DERP_002194 [Dermatophagoides pteronyssinus]|uniref:Uncharacterized protein n=1 Tax=Dermatophagoides pteronyssinus TaxID=6956 RepID=A0ABQ8JH49_DERPT|nr:hypothetical protein DERP_002194 [Dermatophagoides pteronyssinus]
MKSMMAHFQTKKKRSLFRGPMIFDNNSNVEDDAKKIIINGKNIGRHKMLSMLIMTHHEINRSTDKFLISCVNRNLGPIGIPKFLNE